MKKLIVVFVILILFFSIFPSYSENIRGEVLKNIRLTDSSITGDNKFTMGIEDVFAVTIDNNSEFLRGYEVEVSIPADLRRYGSSFAFNIYSRISPEITEGMGTYYGRKYESIILPESARFYIRIPAGERLPNETEPYTTVLSKVTSKTDYPMMFTILPMMKGFPSSLYNSSFSISVSPLLREAGRLNLDVIIPEGLDSADLQLMIDGKPADDTGEYRLAPGSHSLSADIPGGRSINRTFSISSGEVTDLDIEIEKLESTVFIDVPENTIIYIDGEKVDSGTENKLIIDPGEHLVLFKIGDYKISKKFEILPGKDCKISLFLDIFIEEN
jgi:hypothetical protein